MKESGPEILGESGFAIESVGNGDLRELGKVIKVIGLGGQGGNALQHIYDFNLPYVSYLACNTDVRDLQKLTIGDENKMLIGATLTRRLGAGGNPDHGADAMRENEQQLRQLLQAEVEREEDPLAFVFIMAGLGGGTGSGSSRVVAQVCRELGLLTVAVLTLPPFDDGRNSTEVAMDALEEVQKYVDAVILVDNDNIYHFFPDDTEEEGFRKIDQLIAGAVKSIVELLVRVPRINMDLNDVRSTLERGEETSVAKMAIIGTGVASGENRVEEAIDAAINSPLLLRNTLKGATQVLYQTLSGDSAPLKNSETTYLKSLITQKAGNHVNFRRGSGSDNDITDGALQVTIIATDFLQIDTPLSVYKSIVEEKRAANGMLSGGENIKESASSLLGNSSPMSESQKSKTTRQGRGIPSGSVIELPTRYEESQGKPRAAAALKQVDRSYPNPDGNLFSIAAGEENFTPGNIANSTGKAEELRLSENTKSATQQDVNTPAYIRISKRGSKQ